MSITLLQMLKLSIQLGNLLDTVQRPALTVVDLTHKKLIISVALYYRVRYCYVLSDRMN